ncbi:MAG: hypothetical protein IH950_11170 [Bacteroidetes bacterium]|nr:hypothetical protein [Bacteroidota bacterium]
MVNLSSPIVILLYETFKEFIPGGIPSRMDERSFTHSTNLPFNPKRGLHSFFPTGFT